jgi:hypothetical protein
MCFFSNPCESQALSLHFPNKRIPDYLILRYSWRPSGPIKVHFQCCDSLKSEAGYNSSQFWRLLQIFVDDDLIDMFLFLFLEWIKSNDIRYLLTGSDELSYTCLY